MGRKRWERCACFSPGWHAGGTAPREGAGSGVSGAAKGRVALQQLPSVLVDAVPGADAARGTPAPRQCVQLRYAFGILLYMSRHGKWRHCLSGRILTMAQDHHRHLIFRQHLFAEHQFCVPTKGNFLCTHVV